MALKNKKSLLDSTWEKLDADFSIIDTIKEKGHFIISAEQIKKVREPRLVTKFDHSINLPQLFKKHHISIMPISRSQYILSNHDMFCKIGMFPKDVELRTIPGYLESINRDSISSEPVALNCSYITGMLSDFIGDENMVPTVEGRMSTHSFTFNIFNNSKSNFDPVKVDNSQIEIDGAFEGTNFLTLVEAKQHIATDFLIRQLYYPFRLWHDKIRKDIRLVYFVYSNSIFTFFEYSFDDPKNYNSLSLIKSKSYALEDTNINIETIQNILESTTIVAEPEIPFPQADDFRKVINLCELCYANDLTKESIATEYEFNIRQSDYYTNACRYLGLMNKFSARTKNPYFKLSDDGIKMLKMSFIDRQIFLIKKIVEHKVFNEALRMSFEIHSSPTNKMIEPLLKENETYKVGSKRDDATTFKRRASSVRGWINWILSIINE